MANPKKRKRGPRQPELCVRFPCSGCRQLLLVPVAERDTAVPKCPGCAAAVEVPALDPQLGGMEQILKGHETNGAAAASSKSSPHPEQPKSPSPPSQPCCPACHAPLLLQLAQPPHGLNGSPVQAAKAKPSPPPTVPPSKPAPEKRKRATPAQVPQAKAPDPPSVSPPPRPKVAAPSPPTPPRDESPAEVVPPRRRYHSKPPAASPDPAEVRLRSEYTPPRGKLSSPPRDPPLETKTRRGPEPVVYGPQHRATANTGGWGGISASPRGVHWTLWLLIRFGYPLYGAVLYAKYADTPQMAQHYFVSITGLLWLLFGWPASNFIAWRLTPLFVSHFHCPGCEEEYSVHGRWKCACGYTDHREQHVLRFRCPMCKSWIGHMACLRCESTIILR